MHVRSFALHCDSPFVTAVLAPAPLPLVLAEAAAAVVLSIARPGNSVSAHLDCDKTRGVYLGSVPQSDSGIVQIAAAGPLRPLLLRGHYCASSPWKRGSVQGLVLA